MFTTPNLGRCAVSDLNPSHSWKQITTNVDYSSPQGALTIACHKHPVLRIWFWLNGLTGDCAENKEVRPEFERFSSRVALEVSSVLVVNDF